jgi:hypothetical protein
VPIARPFGLAIGFGGDDRSDSPLGQDIDERIGVESLFGDQDIRIDCFDQRLGASQIVGLTRREHQVDRIAKGIDEGMDFGGQSAAGSTNYLLAVFFSRPSLCWRARTMVASVIMYSLS